MEVTTWKGQGREGAVIASDKLTECPMQHGQIEKEWCDLAQQVDICKGCPHNLGRDKSKWQEENNGNRKESK